MVAEDAPMLLSSSGMRGATKLMPKARKKTVKNMEKSALFILCTISNGSLIIKEFGQQTLGTWSFKLYRNALSKYNDNKVDILSFRRAEPVNEIRSKL